MINVEIYSTPICAWCASAKLLLRSKNLAFNEIDVTSDRDLLIEMISRSGRRSVPQIFINGIHIGGYQELAKLDLDNMVSNPDSITRNCSNGQVQTSAPFRP